MRLIVSTGLRRGSLPRKVIDDHEKTLLNRRHTIFFLLQYACVQALHPILGMIGIASTKKQKQKQQPETETETETRMLSRYSHFEGSVM